MAAKRPTPEEIAERVVWGVENDFVSETTEFLVDRLTSVDWHDARAEYWVMRMANENSALLMDIYLKYRDDITDEAREIIEPYVRDIDTERALTDATGLAANSVPYTAATERIVNATVKGCTEIIQRQNVALVDSLANTWYEVATTAVTRQSRVMASEREIISDAVDELMKAHLYTVDYKSGVHTSIDAAIRRHLVSQVNQNYQRMTDLRAREYGWDLFMCSSHVDSRPEHYELQGKVYSKGQHIGERVDGHVVHDYDEMEIGSVTGIYGANCRHYTTVYIPGLSEVQEPPYSAAENEKRYNLTQKQRAMERQIRNTKAEIAGLEDAGLDATDARLRLGVQQAKIRNFCAENSLTRRADLERAYGIAKQPRALRGTMARSSTARRTETKVKTTVSDATRLETAEGIATRDSVKLQKATKPETAAQLGVYVEQSILSGDAARENAARVFVSTVTGDAKYTRVNTKRKTASYFSAKKEIRITRNYDVPPRTIVHETAHLADFQHVITYGPHSMKTSSMGWNSAAFTTGSGNIVYHMRNDWDNLKKAAADSGTDIGLFVKRKIERAGLNPSSYDETGFVSDMLDAVSNGTVRFSGGHTYTNPRYWSGNAGADIIAAECLANYSGSAVCNVVEYELMKELFPNACAIMDELLEVMANVQ